jgi:hypothetical protein
MVDGRICVSECGNHTSVMNSYINVKTADWIGRSCSDSNSTGCFVVFLCFWKFRVGWVNIVNCRLVIPTSMLN